jgi:hypothetical protein
LCAGKRINQLPAATEFCAHRLQGTSAYTGLLETLATMVEAFELGEPLPVLQVSPGLIPTRLKRYLLEPSGAIVRDRYEFMLYRQLRDGLEAGDLHCRDSARFRSFDDDLVDDETFDRRAELFPRHGLENAARPLREQLEELRDLVETRFESVNRRILAGENRFVRVQDGKTVWERAVRSEEPVPGEPFFDMVERLDIDTLLLFVDRRNGDPLMKLGRPSSTCSGATASRAHRSRRSSPA